MDEMYRNRWGCYSIILEKWVWIIFKWNEVNKSCIFIKEDI